MISPIRPSRQISRNADRGLIATVPGCDLRSTKAAKAVQFAPSEFVILSGQINL